jgi:hypothetical protein
MCSAKSTFFSLFGTIILSFFAWLQYYYYFYRNVDQNLFISIELSFRLCKTVKIDIWFFCKYKLHEAHESNRRIWWHDYYITRDRENTILRIFYSKISIPISYYFSCVLPKSQQVYETVRLPNKQTNQTQTLTCQIDFWKATIPYF